MKYEEYQAYEKRVKSFFEKHGLNNLSCNYNDETGDPESFFSHNPCDCCGTKLGGTRYECNGYSETEKDVLDFACVCEDCVYYAEYGQLDDMTMMEIKDWPGK